eukprot:4433625-Pleurochrysis_carterae.AAC.3
MRPCVCACACARMRGITFCGALTLALAPAPCARVRIHLCGTPAELAARNLLCPCFTCLASHTKSHRRMTPYANARHSVILGCTIL